MIAGREELLKVVRSVARHTPARDAYTEITPDCLADATQNGVDALLTIPTLRAEAARYGVFCAGDAREAADAVYRTLFLDRSPVSDAAQAVLWALKRMGISMGDRNLTEARRMWGRRRGLDRTLDALDMAGLAQVAVRVDLFDEAARDPAETDERLFASMRLDALCAPETAWPLLAARGVEKPEALHAFLLGAAEAVGAKSFAWVDAPCAPFFPVVLRAAETLGIPAQAVPANAVLPDAQALCDRVAREGFSFAPYQSGATLPVLLPALWAVARRRVGEALEERYLRLLGSGWPLTSGEIEHDMRQFFFAPQRAE